jgi:hypothetical protein
MAPCLSASDLRAAEASLQVPAFARFGADCATFERSQLARFGVDHAKGSRRSGDRVNTSRRMLDLK